MRLGVIAAVLVAAHVGGLISTHLLGHDRLFGLIPLFDLDVENNLPTFYSALLLLLCSMLFGVIAAARRRLGAGDRWPWASLCAVFLFLAFDESAMFHERISGRLREAFQTTGILHDAWVIPYGLLLVVLLALYHRFVLGLPARTRRLMLLAASAYVAGAFGLELVGGYYWTSEGMVYGTYRIIQTFEESLELLGLLILSYALLSYIAVELDGTRLQISPD